MYYYILHDGIIIILTYSQLSLTLPIHISQIIGQNPEENIWVGSYSKFLGSSVMRIIHYIQADQNIALVKSCILLFLANHHAMEIMFF